MISPGNTFCQWTVLALAEPKYAEKVPKWRCQCSCGAIRDLSESHLTSFRTKSCGHREKIPKPTDVPAWVAYLANSNGISISVVRDRRRLGWTWKKAATQPVRRYG